MAPTLLAKGLKLRELALLSAVAETGQIGSAARQMNMTQPAASRMIAQLEAVCGATLIARHPRGVHLTAAGQRLADRAARIIRELDLAGKEVIAIDSGTAGTVALGSVSGPSLDLVLPVLQNLRLVHPAIVPEITVDSSDHLIAQLAAGRLAFYIGRVPDNAVGSEFDFLPIGTEPLALIVRQGHVLDRAENLDLTDCLGFDWVMQQRGGLLRTTVEQYLLNGGRHLPPRVISTPSLMLTLAFVMRTNAIGTMATAAAAFFANRDGHGLPIRQLDVAHDLTVSTYGIVTMRDRPIAAAAETLRAALARAAGVSGTAPA